MLMAIKLHMGIQLSEYPKYLIPSIAGMEPNFGSGRNKDMDPRTSRSKNYIVFKGLYRVIFVFNGADQ